MLTDSLIEKRVSLLMKSGPLVSFLARARAFWYASIASVKRWVSMRMLPSWIHAFRLLGSLLTASWRSFISFWDWTGPVGA